MQFFDPANFEGARAWEALDIAEIEGATVRLHWTDKPYKWHTNDGAEVFVVLEGQVDMHFREGGAEHVRRLDAGEICFAEIGDEHVAHPVRPSRVLVIEKKGSV